jgi:uncharacterized membrane protein YccF (DUF307 family)
VTQVFQFFRNGIAYVFDSINSVSFEMYGLTVSLGWLFIGFIAIYIVVSVFWRGARG